MSMRRFVLFALLFSAPAFAQYRSYSSSDNLEGLYLAGGGGGALMLTSDANGFGWDAEARLGYSFGATQIYLTGAVDSATLINTTLTVKDVGVSVQYHIAGNHSVKAYTRFGIGVGFTDLGIPNSSLAGLAGWGGIGMEIRLSDAIFLAPELVYRNASMSGNGNSLGVNVIGLQVTLVYY